MKPLDVSGTGAGFLYHAIRPAYLMIAPTLGETFSRYAFPDDLPAGAWLDAPEDLPGGSVYLGKTGRQYQSAAQRT